MANFLENNLVNPAKARLKGLYDKGVNRAKGLTSLREGGAPDEGLINNIAATAQDQVNAVLTNTLKKGGKEAQDIADGVQNTAAGIKNVFANPVMGTIKLPFAIANETADAVLDTMSNSYNWVRDGVEGIIYNTADRVGHVLNMIPVAGGALRATTHLASKVFHAPLNVIDKSAELIGGRINKIINWTRQKTLGITEQAA